MQIMPRKYSTEIYTLLQRGEVTKKNIQNHPKPLILQHSQFENQTVIVYKSAV